MIICFECRADTKRQMDELVRTGAYADYGDVIATAVANQVLLGARVASGGALVLAGDDSSVVGVHHAPTATAESRSSDRPGSARRTDGRQGNRLRVPAMFSLEGLDQALVEPAIPPDDVWSPGAVVPVSRWLWGQYNRLLPAKASCRALARLLLEELGGVPVSDAGPRIADAAAELGDYLCQFDAAHAFPRDEALAIAFPRSGQGGEKGRLRYSSQFVGGVNTEGHVTGMLADLKLVNWTGRKDPRLRLTEIGWRLAALRNPILDASRAEPGSKLSEEEIELLIMHIASSVPAEDFAYRTLIAAIERGASTPDVLDDALEKTAGNGSPAAISRAFLSTQRAGVVSRMSDLDLVARQRTGVKVSYVVTERGKNYPSCR